MSSDSDWVDDVRKWVEGGKRPVRPPQSLEPSVGHSVCPGLLALVGLVLVGIALLLRASISSVDYPAEWALLVVPLTPFVIAAVMVFVARSKPIEKAFDTVKKQMKSDMDLLRDVSST